MWGASCSQSVSLQTQSTQNNTAFSIQGIKVHLTASLSLFKAERKQGRVQLWPRGDHRRGSSQGLRGELGVAGRREASAQVLEDVKRQATHQRDGGHLPQERHRGDKIHIWAEEEPQFSEEATVQSDYRRKKSVGWNAKWCQRYRVPTFTTKRPWCAHVMHLLLLYQRTELRWRQSPDWRLQV